MFINKYTNVVIWNFFYYLCTMNDVDVFIRLVRRVYPDTRFGKSLGGSGRPMVVVFTDNPEVRKYSNQVKSFLGNTIEIMFLSENYRPSIKTPEKTILDELSNFIFSYFNFFNWFKRKNPLKWGFFYDSTISCIFGINWFCLIKWNATCGISQFTNSILTFGHVEMLLLCFTCLSAFWATIE